MVTLFLFAQTFSVFALNTIHCLSRNMNIQISIEDKQIDIYVY